MFPANENREIIISMDTKLVNIIKQTILNVVV
jgi:hypothetical protein